MTHDDSRFWNLIFVCEVGCGGQWRKEKKLKEMPEGSVFGLCGLCGKLTASLWHNADYFIYGQQVRAGAPCWALSRQEFITAPGPP